MGLELLKAKMADTAAQEESKKRGLEGGAESESKRPAGDGSEESALKILVSNSDAGAVIGKAGAVINQIQTDSSARVKMSQSGDFFPGTGDRVVLITGTSTAVYEALSLIVAKLAGIETADENALVLKMPVPNSSGGAIIGKGGAEIKAMSESTGAKVQLSQKDEVHPELQERVCTISGSSVQILQAGQQVFLKLQETDAKYSNLSTNYGSSKAPAQQFGQQAMYGQAAMMQQRMYQQPQQAYYQQQAAPQAAAPQYGAPSAGGTSVTMTVPDAQVGILVGKAGCMIQAMQAQSGARITVSQRDGSGGDRTVSISGDPQAVANGQMLVSQKLQEAAQMPAQF